VIERTNETITPNERCTPEQSRQSIIPLFTEAQEAMFPKVYYYRNKNIRKFYEKILEKIQYFYYLISILPQSIHCPFPGSLRML
jgi:hypothetical protein